MLRVITPASFTGEIGANRAMGTETEFAVIRATGEGDLGVRDLALDDEVLTRAGIPFVRIKDSTRRWLYNGGLLYPDVGHAEVCTPICAGPWQLAIADQAGSRILSQALQAADELIVAQFATSDLSYAELQKAIRSKKLRAFRRAGTIALGTEYVSTKAWHLSESTPTETGTVQSVSKLLPHLATRFYTWAGMVAAEGYVMSQKSFGIGNNNLLQTKSSVAGRGRSKPLAILYASGNEPAKNPNYYRRFEDRSGDPSTAWATFMAAATNSLGLRITEHPTMQNRKGRKILEMLDAVQLDRPADAMGFLSQDITFQRTVEVASGKQLSIINFQEVYHEAFTELEKRMLLPADEVYAIAELERIVQDTRATAADENWQHISDRVGFAAKLDYLQRQQDRGIFDGPLTSSNAPALVRCIDFDRTYPTGGAQIYAERINGFPIGTNDEIEKLVVEPPEGTSAKPLVEAMRRYRDKIVSITWTSLQFSEGETTKRIQLNPYDTVLPNA